MADNGQTRTQVRRSPKSNRIAAGVLRFEKAIAGLVKDVELLHKQLLAEIKERESAERALRRSEETVRALLNAPTDTALLIDRKGTILAANETALIRLGIHAADDLGRDPRDLVGACVYDFFPPDLAKQRKARNDEVFRTGTPAQFEDEREGTWYANSIYPVRGSRSRIVGLAIFSRDITERKVAEESLRKSTETVRALLNAPSDSALLIDAKGIILSLNEAAKQRLAAHVNGTNGGKPAELVGRCVYDLFPPELAESRRARNEEVIRSGRPARFEDERSGAWFDNSAYPVFGGNGEVTGLAIVTRDISDRKRTEETIKHLAYHDPLTGLHNRAAFQSRFEAAVDNARQRGRGLAVMSMDLDHFKAINDTMGHPVGDRLLQSVGQRLTQLIRDGDTAARIGGDEFTIVFPGISRGEEACRIAERILRAIGDPFQIDGHEVRASTSLGVSLYPQDAQDCRGLLRAADAAMYRAKKRRSNSYELYSQTPRRSPQASRR